MNPFSSILKSFKPSALALLLGLAIVVGFTPLANAQVTAPTITTTGGPYTSLFGNNLTLNGNAVQSNADPLIYSWAILEPTNTYLTFYTGAVGNTTIPWTLLYNDGVTGPGNYGLQLTAKDSIWAYTAQQNTTLTILSAPVPEPSELLLTMCGFGLIGFLARRRKYSSSNLPA